MTKIKTISLISVLVSLSMLCYAIRGKAGAIVITLLIFVLSVYLIKEKKIKKSFSALFGVFILAFSLVLGIIRSCDFEYYLFVGYLGAILILLNNNLDVYKNIWIFLGKISIFEALGVFIQKLFPSFYYSCISLVLPSSVVMSIKNRLVEGYYTGFTRETSFTMFLIVIGLGIYFFDLLKKDDVKIDLNYKIKKYIIISFLFFALLISGKRAPLLFFIVAMIIVRLIKSKKPLKYLLFLITGGGILFLLLYISFPIWSKISFLSRIVELLKYISDKNIIGITNGRVVIYQNALDLWNYNRLFGIGWGNFKYMVSSSLWYSGYDVHNCFLQILCETGLIGAIFFAILTITSIYRFIKCVIKSREYGNDYYYKLSLLVAYIQVFFIIYSFTEPILYEYTDYIIYFVSINITDLLLYELNNRKEKNIKRVRRGRHKINEKVTR